MATYPDRAAVLQHLPRWLEHDGINPGSPLAARLAEAQEHLRERFANPFSAAERGFIDDIIKPHETRPKLIRALRMLETKVDTSPRKKHGNIPL